MFKSPKKNNEYNKKENPYNKLYEDVNSLSLKLKKLEVFIEKIYLDELKGKFSSDYSGNPTNIIRGLFTTRKTYIKQLRTEKDSIKSEIRIKKAQLEYAEVADKNFWKHKRSLERFYEKNDLNYSIETKTSSEYKGYVYALKNEYAPNLLKIGFTGRTPNKRLTEIESSTGTIPGYYIDFYIKTSNYIFLENVIHKKFSSCRVSKNREFFEITSDEVINYVKSIKEIDVEVYTDI